MRLLEHIVYQQRPDDLGQLVAKRQVLFRINVYSIDVAGSDDTAGIEEMTIGFFADLPIRSGQAKALSLTTFKLRRNRPLGRLNSRGSHHQYLGHRHSGLNRRCADRRDKRENALRGMPCIVLVHGLEVVGTEHQDDKLKRRVYLDPLS